MVNIVAKKIVLIGPIPPPFGGVSIHIQRLSLLLEDDFEIAFIDESHIIKSKYFNIRSWNFISYFRRIIHSDLLYIHSGKRLLKFFHLLVGSIFLKKIILTIHSYRSTNNLFIRYADELIYRLSNLIVIVNPDILENLSLPVAKCVIIQPFIPPKMEIEPFLPTFVDNWIQDRKTKGRTILCANAWQLATYKNEDLYGLDLLIEVAGQLFKQKISISFVFNVASIEKFKEIYLKYHSIIEKSEFKDDFLLINENLSFVKLIEKSDVVIRPTNTDGDALTIREALFLGKPIIASDVVRRPEGTILFRTRDESDLGEKIIKCINDLTTVNSNQKYRKESAEYYKPYAEILTKVLKG